MSQNQSTKKERDAKLASIRRRRKVTALRRFALVGAIALFILLLYNGFFVPVIDFMGDTVGNIRLSLDQGDGFPAELQMPGIISATDIGDGAVVVGENDMVFISPSGKQTRRIGNSYANPLIESSDDRVLINTRGANDIKIEGYYESYLTKELDEDIFLAAISNSGAFALAVSDPMFRSSINIYNANGSELFEYKLADEMPVVIKFSENSRYLAVASIYSVDGVLMTNLYSFSVHDYELIGMIEGIEGVCVDLELQASDRILAVFDNMAAVYDLGEGTAIAEYDFDDRQLLKVAMTDGGDKLSLLLGELQLPSSITLMTFSSSLEARGETIMPFSVDNIGYSGYNLFVSSGEILTRYDDRAMPIEEDRVVFDESILSLLKNGLCIGSEYIYRY